MPRGEQRRGVGREAARGGLNGKAVRSPRRLTRRLPNEEGFGTVVVQVRRTRAAA